MDILSFLSQLDTDILLTINGYRSAWADQFMYAFSGKWIWVPMYVSLIYLIFRNLHWKTALACAVAITLTITFADQVCATLIRPFVARLRPSNLENPLSSLIHIVNEYRGGRYGFPSCHAANTAGLACFLTLLFRHRLLTASLWTWALLTCYSRAYLGVHYPGDLLCGAFIGCAGACLCYLLFQKSCQYKRPSSLRHGWIPIAVYATTTAAMMLYGCFPN